ncbi:MAG: calcium/sodium antiporter [Firmicutes bacterium]|nr:calcium/sodium antiporter [Bacillota bacterium]
MQYIGLIVGFVLLIKCADWFVDGSSNLAKALGVPTLVIGLTIVAFGTSAPEAAVSISASLSGQNEIAVGNAVGSSICNLLLVLGASAAVFPMAAPKSVLKKDYMFAVLAAFVLIFVTGDVFLSGGFEGFIVQLRSAMSAAGNADAAAASADKVISYVTRSEGLILLTFVITYVYSLILGVLGNKDDEDEKGRFSWKDLLMIVIGMLGIMIGGDLVVDSSVKIAESFGISTQLIALTVVALGTSLPELVTSVVAARKRETDIALGNVIGSNIFNIFFVLGSAAVVSPLTLDITAFTDILIMTAVSLVVLALASFRSNISRPNGIFMLVMYAAYTGYIIVR